MSRKRIIILIEIQGRASGNLNMCCCMSECRENFYIIVKKQNYRVYATCTEGTSGILRPPFAFTLLGPGILLTVHVANTVLVSVSAAVVILISAHCFSRLFYLLYSEKSKIYLLLFVAICR